MVLLLRSRSSWLRRACALAAVSSVGLTQEASSWRSYRAADGLRESLTTAVTISPRGNIWVKHGEVDAVSWLDGYTVRHIPAPGERNNRVYESRAGRIWSVDTVGILEFAGEQWQRHPLAELAAERRGTPFFSFRRAPLLPAEQDRVLLLLRERLLEFRALRGEEGVLKLATNTSLGQFTDMIGAVDGGAWITGTRGLAKLPGPLRQISTNTAWTEHGLPPQVQVQNLQRPLEDDDGGITTVGDLIGADRRVLVHFDGHDWQVRPVPGENLRFAWRGTEPGEFWATTSTSLLRILPDHVEVVRDGPRATQYFDVAVQPRGVFWLATLEGLVRHAPPVWRTPAPAKPFDSPIHSAAEDAQGTLWFANANGLIEGRKDRWERHPWPRGFEPDFRARDGVFVLPKGRIVVCATQQLLTFDPVTRAFTAVGHPDGRRIRKVLHQFADGTLCVQTAVEGAGGADYRFERFDGERVRAWPEAPPAIDLGTELFFLAETANGEIWLGGNAGVAVRRGGTWQQFGAADDYHDEGALNWLELGDGRIWCAGLNRISEYDGRNWRLVRAGFDRVSGMIRATDGSVWVASSSGLYRYYRESWAWVAEPEGLPSSTTYVVLEDRARQVWVGTSRGLSLYFPRADNDAPRTLNITVQQFGIGTPEATVDVSFQAVDKWRFTPEERLLYSYRLGEGTWSVFDRATNVTFRDMAAGRYQFEVRAMDRNWNVELRPEKREFRVTVPWFRDNRVLVALGVGLVATLAFAGLAVNRHLNLRRSYARVEKRVEERTIELRRATEALAQSQKMTALGTLAAGIAHDFNSILSIIRGSAQIIETNLEDREKVLTRVQRIKTVVDQASAVVRALLGFGRLSERQIETLDASRVVEETVGLLGDQFRRGVSIRIEAPPDLPAVRAVRDRLQQMLLNLILNAADAMEGKGQIGIRLWSSGTVPGLLTLAPATALTYVLVSVTDQGTGISAETLPRIFEPFFTTKALSARRGAGLGLYMVYEFAAEMGHGILVQTEPGRGSIFTLILPAAEPPPPLPAEAGSREPSI